MEIIAQTQSFHVIIVVVETAAFATVAITTITISIIVLISTFLLQSFALILVSAIETMKAI